jgi:hypothetical protein
MFFLMSYKMYLVEITFDDIYTLVQVSIKTWQKVKNILTSKYILSNTVLMMSTGPTSQDQ